MPNAATPADCNDVHGHFWKFTFFISAMKRGSERSESKILSILRKMSPCEWAA
jgi:hypothetical protein